VSNNEVQSVEEQIEALRCQLENEYKTEEKRLLEEKQKAYERLDEMEKQTIQEIENEWQNKEARVKQQTIDYEKEIRQDLSSLMNDISKSIKIKSLVEEAVALVLNKK
jgi:hypothetical protein